MRIGLKPTARGFLIVVAALLCVASGCKKAEKEKEPVVSVQTTPAQRATISQVITAEAVVYPLQQAVITPKITSTIKQFLVERGTPVRKGQLLAVLENADLAAAAEQSKGEFEQAQAGYATTTGAGIPEQIQKAELDAAAAKSAYEAQQKVYESRKELYAQGAIPRRDLDAGEVALAQARTQNEVAQKQLEDLKRLGEKQAYKSAGGQLSAATGKFRAAEAQLSYSQIRSPIDGVVTDRPLHAGELAAANQPLITVMNIKKLIAKAHIAQSESVVLQAGNPAEINIAGLDEPIPAHVTLVSPALDPGSTTIEVWVEAVKPNPALRPGMTVEVAMTAKTATDALVVPLPAVYKNAEGADYVLIAGSDEHAHLKIVQVGIRSKEFAQVASGINSGDPVITSGGYALPDNTQIKVEAAETDAGNKGDKAEKSDKSDKAEGADKKNSTEKKDTKDKSDHKDKKSGSAKPADQDKE